MLRIRIFDSIMIFAGAQMIYDASPIWHCTKDIIGMSAVTAEINGVYLDTVFAWMDDSRRNYS